MSQVGLEPTISVCDRHNGSSGPGQPEAV